MITSRFYLRIMAVIVPTLFLTNVSARDLGQWQDNPQSEWFARQKQPGTEISCCGASDAYEADEFITEGEQYFAVITDTRDDAPLMRPHIPAGTRIAIPPEKIKRDNKDPNPSGHGLVFVGSTGMVYCYFSPALL